MTLVAPPPPAHVRPGSSVRRPVVSELIVVLFLLRIYDVVRAHADVRRDLALAHAHQVLDLERMLRLDPEQAVNAALTRHAHLSALAVAWYQYLHIPVTMSLLLLCWLLRPAQYRPLRTSLVLLNVVGLATFLLWPLAPPRLVPGAGFVDSVAVAGHHVVTGTSRVSVDQFGAMPSLHIAWAVWSAAAAVLLLQAPRWRRLRQASWLYPVVTVVVVVATANHYVVDVVAGVLTAGAALWVSRRCDARTVVPAVARA